MQNSKLPASPAGRQLKTQKFRDFLETFHFLLCTLRSRRGRAGFTLIELMVVVSVLIAVGVVISSVLFSTLRGTTKTNTITVVRQNGNFAISQVVKMVRFAKRLDSPKPCILPPSPTPTPSYQSIEITSLDGRQTVFSCLGSTGSTGSTIASNGVSLLDTSAVDLVSCSFTCSRASSSDFPTIGIQFSLTQKDPSSVPERTGSIPFQTSVTMRNLQE